jgi:2-amino-4-hydroxy-6-hydroxymethyldihydropteridine diphosphokinase
MIIVALGSNIHGPWGSPRQSVERALIELDKGPVKVIKVSKLIETEPFGVANQPKFVNAVAIIATHLPPFALMRRLHAIERQGGRRRHVRWGPRTIDLDLIDYHGLVSRSKKQSNAKVELPHPGIEFRSFVLMPLAEVAPQWRHPILLMVPNQLLRKLAG